MDLSVVVPIYNEAENITSQHSDITLAIKNLGFDYEIIYIDDGSHDSSFELLRELAKHDQRIIIISFRKNFGQTAALSAGFDYCKGRLVVTIDGDLQNDPHDIPKLLAKLNEGYDIVVGWRFDRQDPFFSRKLPSRLANCFISCITKVHLHDYGCTLKAFKREVVKNICLYGEMHRFIPAIASWMGVKIAEIPVNHRMRQAGKSKYGISRTPKVILDLIAIKFLLSYATRPIQIFGLWGLITGATGFLLALFYTIERLFFGIQLANKPGLFLAILLIFIGVQLITMGLLGEMQVRIYYEVQKKPTYIIREIINYKSPKNNKKMSSY